jgi:hypothetical protein
MDLPRCFVGQPDTRQCQAVGTCPSDEKVTCPLLMHPGKDLEAVYDESSKGFICGRPII